MARTPSGLMSLTRTEYTVWNTGLFPVLLLHCLRPLSVVGYLPSFGSFGMRSLNP